jgi:hypothetical protein
VILPTASQSLCIPNGVAHDQVIEMPLPDKKGFDVETFHRSVDDALTIGELTNAQVTQYTGQVSRLIGHLESLTNSTSHDVSRTEFYVQQALKQSATADQADAGWLQRGFNQLKEVGASVCHTAANALTGAARTAAVVTLAMVARELATYYGREALDNAETPEGDRAAVAMVLMMLGPLANAAGMMREGWQGCATLQSQVGRGVMLAMSAVAGASLALTPKPMETLASMAPAQIGLTAYVAGDLIRTFVPLSTNAPGISLAPTVMAAGIYGSAGAVVDNIVGRVITSLNASEVGEPGLQVWSALTRSLGVALYSAIDDVVLPLLNKWLSSDASTEPFKMEVQFKGATLKDLLRSVDTGGALRHSAINVITNVFTVASLALDKTESLSQAEREIANGVLLAVAFMAIYPPFVYGTLADTSPTEPVASRPGSAAVSLDVEATVQAPSAGSVQIARDPSREAIDRKLDDVS